MKLIELLEYDIYPLTIIKDRYTGVYSHGKYTAWNISFEDIPYAIDDEDTECRSFWYSNENACIGLGDTPEDALEDLIRKIEAGTYDREIRTISKQKG